MKRSEMINKLLMPVSLVAGGMLTRQEIEETADSLLKILEKAGMKPPETNVPRQKGSCLCTMRESCEYCSDHFRDNRWDNE